MEGNTCMKKIITEYKTCVHNFELENKREDMEEQRIQSSAQRKSRIQPSVVKAILKMFVNHKGQCCIIIWRRSNQ